MKKSEIDNNFDEIVEFSGVGKFIDTPVKRYSSGMGVRLAFAVAAHLEPEILLVDEVLAVGDIEFQKKCLNKMNDITNEGRTVLFVSHNLGAVKELCDRVLLIQKGKKVLLSDPDTAINKYLENKLISEEPFIDFSIDSSKPFYFKSVRLVDSENKLKSSFDIFEQIFIEIEYHVKEELRGSIISLCVNRDGKHIFKTYDNDLNQRYFEKRHKGNYNVAIPLPLKTLNPGKYSIDLCCSEPANNVVHAIYENFILFKVISSRNNSYKSYGVSPGEVMAIIDWKYK